jgi:hypothetical protein
MTSERPEMTIAALDGTATDLLPHMVDEAGLNLRQTEVPVKRVGRNARKLKNSLLDNELRG